jgi:hypothetical protein
VLKALEDDPNVDRTAMAITRSLGRIAEPDEYKKPAPPPPSGQPQGQSAEPTAAPQEAPTPMSQYDRAMLEKQNRERMRLQQLQQQTPVGP